MKLSDQEVRVTIVREEGYRFRGEAEMSDAPGFFMEERAGFS